jgi:hypothetical protein
MPVDKSRGLRSDQTRVLPTPLASQRYPAPLHRISFYAKDIDKRFFYRPSPSPRFIDAVGRPNSSSNGSSNSYGSKDSNASSELPLTASRLRSGSPSPSACWSPFSNSNFAWTNLSTQFCKFSPHPFREEQIQNVVFANSWHCSTFNRTALIRNPKLDESNLKFRI